MGFALHGAAKRYESRGMVVNELITRDLRMTFGFKWVSHEPLAT